MKILAFGEIIFDIFNGNETMGGAPLNFCAHAVRAGAQAYLMSAVGNDAYGIEARQKIAYYGVDDTYVGTVEGYPTGTCNVQLNEKGEPTYLLAEDTAYDYISMPEELPEDLDVFYFGTLALRQEHNRKILQRLLRKKPAQEVFVDINIRPPFDLFENITMALKHATILKISEEELPLVVGRIFGGAYTTNTAIYALIKRYKNLKLILLTRGEDGSVAYDQFDGEVHFCDAVKTQVVSTVGAGDSFSATFVVNYLRGDKCDEALRKASEVSAYVVSHSGAIPED